MKDLFKIDWFIVLILIAITLAYYFPIGETVFRHLPFESTLSLGISLIFFFYGLKLNPEKMKAGLKNWKLHVLIQFSTFLMFPVLVYAVKPLMVEDSWSSIWLGLFFLAALPSTVSSSVVMVSIAKGNIPASIFNSSLSGLLGIVITPFLLGMVIQTNSETFDFSSIYFQLLTEILFPVGLGILLQSWGGEMVNRYSKALSNFDKMIILLIVYKSFSHSFLQNVFQNISWFDLVKIFGLVILLFFTVYFSIGKLTKWLKFDKKDSITAKFCGTKKSLVHGTVFFSLIFGGMANEGLILIPLMVFHSVQILIISIFANQKRKKWGKRKKTKIMYARLI